MREKLGKISSDLLQKDSETRDPIELERAMHKDYESEIWKCIEQHKLIFPHKSFFVVVLTKKERLMQNVLRNYFFARESCPTPEWDQTVYRYDPNGEKIEFLWVIPSKDTCELFKYHILEIVPEEKELLRFILEYEDGTLLQQARNLNKELYGKDYV